MSITLSTYPELILKNINDYSFTKELINNVNNLDFKTSAYETLSGINDTEYSYIWTALSHIVENNSAMSTLLHNNISYEFENDILNYIDNISDIDTCKIKALLSMILHLGVNYTIFDKIKLMPLQILKILDVLSIKKEYLVNSNKVNEIFSNLLFLQISNDLNIDSNISDTVSSLTECRMSSVISSTTEIYPLSTQLDNISVNYKVYLDDEKLHNYTLSTYAKILSSFCYMKYNNDDFGDYIFAHLSSNIILSDFTITNTNIIETEELNTYRLKYNIKNAFNESYELDKIEAGNATYEDYSIHEQYLLSAEAKYRAQPKDSAKLYSRYYYYRERTVREYFKFVENEYANYLSLYLSTEQYNVDNNYIVVTNNIKTSLFNESDCTLNDYMIEYVAQTLTELTEAIRDIREQVKTHVQRNFIKGTKNHIGYVVREYIRNNIYPVYKKLAKSLSFELSQIHDYNVSDVIINVNEYVDPTEYFNISTDIDALSDNVNSRYWEGKSTVNSIAPYNSTNIFKKPSIINSATKQFFSQQDIELMYKLNLQLHFNTLTPLSDLNAPNYYDADQNKHLSLFLNSVYDSAADTTYQDVSSNICCNLDFVDKNIFSGTAIKISDLPLISSEILIQNIKNISSTLEDNLQISEIIHNSILTTQLSNITLNVYNSIISIAKEVLASQNKTLADLNVNDIALQENNTEWRQYKEKLFKKYSGQDSGELSFYNIKNQRHPSYQIHSYIKNFVERNNFEYPIENIANIISENLTDILINNLSNYLDDNGYIISGWNLPFNTNADYLTEYEKSANKSPLNTVSKQIDYDGLFYPAAVNDFLINPDIFIENLSASETSCNNIWYKDLNLTYTERCRIATQLYELKQYISAAVFSNYDIYKYGKDFYGNAYILVKDLSANTFDDLIKMSPDKKNNIAGVMWMRIKNHPIALPMMVYSSISTLNENLTLIEKITAENEQNLKSNTKFDDVEKIAIPNTYIIKTTYVPTCYDFSISKDKTELLFYCKLNEKNNKNKNKKYIIYVNPKKVYYRNKPDQRHKYYFLLNNFNTVFKSLTDPDDTGFEITDDFNFIDFYNFDTYIGVILAKTSDVINNSFTCSINLPYYDKYDINDDNLKEQLLLSCVCDNCADDADDDYRIDVTNKKRLTIAYRTKDFSNLSVEDYLGMKLEYTNTSSPTMQRLNVFTNGIKTIDYRFDKKQFAKIEFDRTCIPYNELGFIPAYEYMNEDTALCSNNLNHKTKIFNEEYNNRHRNGYYYECLSAKGQLKFNLVGRADTNGIFFKNVRPVRTDEDYKTSLSNINTYLPNTYDNKLSAVNYFDAHYSEMSYNKLLSSTYSSIYNPYEFQQKIKNYNISVRLDESYYAIFSTLSNNYTFLSSKTYLDLFGDVPYIWYSNSGELTNFKELYNPGSTGQEICALCSNTYVIHIPNSRTDNMSVDIISVNYIMPNNNVYGNGIKIDFNSELYNPGALGSAPINYFNWKHQFLNLDSSGDAGYLQIWYAKNDGIHESMPYATPGNLYYIKNISDTKPKFILQLSSEIFDALVQPEEFCYLVDDASTLSNTIYLEAIHNKGDVFPTLLALDLIED